MITVYSYSYNDHFSKPTYVLISQRTYLHTSLLELAYVSSGLKT